VSTSAVARKQFIEAIETAGLSFTIGSAVLQLVEAAGYDPLSGPRRDHLDKAREWIDLADETRLEQERAVKPAFVSLDREDPPARPVLAEPAQPAPSSLAIVRRQAAKKAGKKPLPTKAATVASRPTRTCPVCKREKGITGFSRGSVVCRQCVLDGKGDTPQAIAAKQAAQPEPAADDGVRRRCKKCGVAKGLPAFDEGSETCKACASLSVKRFGEARV
jgi:ribosomal protein S14